MKNPIPIWQVSPDLRETGGLGGDNMTAVLVTWLQHAVCGFFVRSTTGNDDFVRFARSDWRCFTFGWFASDWDQLCIVTDREVVLRSLEALVVSVGSLNSRCRRMIPHGNLQVVSVVPSR